MFLLTFLSFFSSACSFPQQTLKKRVRPTRSHSPPSPADKKEKKTSCTDCSGKGTCFSEERKKETFPHCCVPPPPLHRVCICPSLLPLSKGEKCPSLLKLARNTQYLHTTLFSTLASNRSFGLLCKGHLNTRICKVGFPLPS